MVPKCRLCLTESYTNDTLTNIFETKLKYSEASIVDNLYWIFSVEVDPLDEYTKEICEECLNLLECILRNRQVFQNNQLLLTYQKTDSELDGSDTDFKGNKASTKSALVDPNNIPGPSECATTKGKTNKLKSLEQTDTTEPKTPCFSPSRDSIGSPPVLENELLFNQNLDKKMTDECKESDDETNTTFKTDVGTCTENIELKNHVIVSLDYLNLITPRIILEPLDLVIKKENYKKLTTNRYIKEEIQYKPNNAKFKDYIDYYYSIRTSSIRELILGEPIRYTKDIEMTDLLCNVTSQNVYVCEMCSTVFKSKARLKQHNKKKHKRLPIQDWSACDESAIKQIVGVIPFYSTKTLRTYGNPKRHIEIIDLDNSEDEIVDILG